MTVLPRADTQPQHDAGGGRWVWALHAVAAAVVVAGVLAQILRPLAPDLGAPPAPDGFFDSASIQRAMAYRRPLYAVAVVGTLLRLAITAAAALTPWGRAMVAAIVRRAGEHRPALGGGAAIVAIVMLADLVLLPLVFWAGYVHDGRFGLRSQGVGGWAYDWAVFHVPVWIAVAALGAVGYRVARRLPRTWPAVAGVGTGILGLAVAFASPLVLEPLTYRFSPLAAGPVRTEVERVLASAGERIDDIVVADASRRSVRQNAYVSGLGASRRVVLYDTLVQARPAAQVGVVLAHELAHRRNGDLLRLTMLGAAGAVVSAYTISWVVRRRTRRGWQRTPHDPLGAGVVLLVAVLLNLASSPIQAVVSRRAEAAADLGSLQFTDAPDVFVQMQQGLTRANLGEPVPPRAIVLWRESHPSAMARIGMAHWWRRQ